MLRATRIGLTGVLRGCAAPRARHVHRLCLPALCLLAAGCQNDVAVDMQDERQAAFVKMLMPARVEIKRSTKPDDSQYVPGAGVEHMTFEGRGPAHGIEVMIEARDEIGDPVKVLGAFNFELYEANAGPASAKAGERVALWSVELTQESLHQYWERAPRLYKFPLQLDQPATLAPGHYVLEATYVSPWDKKLFATYQFTYRLGSETSGG